MNAMSDDGLYVKRLVENPPRSGGRANVANRYWDIAGRRYDGVYPVDFHLVLTGEEVHSGDVRAAAGNTKVRMTVQGAYASEQMMERILDEWERLHRLLCDTLRNRPRRPPAEPAAPESNPEEGPLLEPDSARGRRSVLLKRREDATSALLEGRISETTYREIVERTTRELDEFDES